MKTIEELDKELMEEIRGLGIIPLPKSPFSGEEDNEWKEQQGLEAKAVSGDNKSVLSGKME